MTSPDDVPDKDDVLDKDQTKSFLEHLEDLRGTIVKCALSLVGGMAIAIPLAPLVLTLIKRPLYDVESDLDIKVDEFLKIMEMTGGLSIALKIVFWGGLLFSIPFLIYFIWEFVFPGLTRRERRTVRAAAGFAALLFAMGVCMCYFMTLPVAIKLMFKVNAWMGVNCNFVRLTDYVAFVLKLLVAFGLAFELPVVLMALGHLGLVTSQQLREKRRHVIVGLLILAMILTPPDPLTQCMMAVPMTALYEICIWLIWLKEKREAAAEA